MIVLAKYLDPKKEEDLKQQCIEELEYIANGYRHCSLNNKQFIQCVGTVIEKYVRGGILPSNYSLFRKLSSTNKILELETYYRGLPIPCVDSIEHFVSYGNFLLHLERRHKNDM